jgi:DNA-directed RNA polymerase subunit alpha
MSRYLDWRNEPVSVLDLTVRARRWLQRLHVATIGQLCALTASDILGACWSETVLNELQERLAELGFRLAGD